MRKLPLLLLALLSTSLLSCDSKDGPASATGSDKDLVSIAPRIVRTAAIRDELWNTTVTVYAGLYDVNDSLIPNTFFSAPFSSGQITLPPIDANKVVSVYVAGQNAAGRRIWSGWTDWYPAGQFSAGVGVRSDITIFPSSAQDSLIGTWTFVNDYADSDRIEYRDVNVLSVHPNGTYTINSVTKLAADTLFFYGYFETGTWSSPQHQLLVTPQTYEVCANLTTGCDTPIGSTSSLYSTETPTGARSFSWYMSDGDIHMQDLANSSNVQYWSPYTP